MIYIQALVNSLMDKGWRRVEGFCPRGVVLVLEDPNTKKRIQFEDRPMNVREAWAQGIPVEFFCPNLEVWVRWPHKHWIAFGNNVDWQICEDSRTSNLPENWSEIKRAWANGDTIFYRLFPNDKWHIWREKDFLKVTTIRDSDGRISCAEYKVMKPSFRVLKTPEGGLLIQTSDDADTLYTPITDWTEIP